MYILCDPNIFLKHFFHVCILTFFLSSFKMKVLQLLISFILLFNSFWAKNVSEIVFPLQSGELNGRMVLKDQR